MKNLIIYVLSIMLALLIGFIGTCTMFVMAEELNVDINTKHDKE